MVKYVAVFVGWVCLVVESADFFAGTAYVHGIKHATGNFIIIMDADLSHHVSCFSCLLSIELHHRNNCTWISQWAVIANV